MKTGNLSAEFEGEVPASSLTNGGSYRFFYVGQNSNGIGDRTVDASRVVSTSTLLSRQVNSKT